MNDLSPIDYMQAQVTKPITGSIAFRALVPKLEARIAELEAENAKLLRDVENEREWCAATAERWNFAAAAAIRARGKP